MLPLNPSQLSSPTRRCTGEEAAGEFDAAAAAVIAHDFNNLLTTILGNLSLALFDRSLNEATQERLITAKKAGLRAQDLAQKLLQLGRESDDPSHALDRLPSDAAPVAERPPRILVLDDEEAICTLVSCALEPLGYEVVEAHDALTAISFYIDALQSGRRFDVVISDLAIPGGMSGQEAVQRLRDLDPDLRAIVSSGYSCDPVLSDYRGYGFCAIIQKPYEIQALGRTIAEVLASPPAGPIAPALNLVEQECAALATA